MKALLITYHFPPMLGCCSLRIGAVARALVERGLECYILTAAIPSDHPVYTVLAQGGILTLIQYEPNHD